MKLNPTQVRTNVTTTKPSPRPGFELATESEADAVRGEASFWIEETSPILSS